MYEVERQGGNDKVELYIGGRGTIAPGTPTTSVISGMRGTDTARGWPPMSGGWRTRAPPTHSRGVWWTAGPGTTARDATCVWRNRSTSCTGARIISSGRKCVQLIGDRKYFLRVLIGSKSFSKMHKMKLKLQKMKLKQKVINIVQRALIRADVILFFIIWFCDNFHFRSAAPSLLSWSSFKI